MTLRLHQHPFASYCWKALIALYEREVPFERRLVEDRAPLAQLWPPASIPVLVDGDLVLPESTTIIEQLDSYGDAPPMIPSDPAAALQARLWDRISDGYVMTPLQKIVGDSLRPEPDRDVYGVAEARTRLEQAYALLDGQLTDTWLAGPDFTIADCAAAPALHYTWVVHRWDRAEHPRLTRYVERVMARPSVARVIDEAREYRVLFPLPWPDDVA